MTFEELSIKDPEYLRWMATLADKDEDFKYTVRHHIDKIEKRR